MLKNNTWKRLKQNKYLTFALLFAFFNMLIVFVLFGFQITSDSDDYFQTIEWFSGAREVMPSLHRFLRPLSPLLAVPFQFLGTGTGLIVQNIIFYLLSALLIFKITESIFHNKKQPFLAVIFFVTALPLIESGLSYLTDMGAWFFYLLSIYLTLLYFSNKNENLIVINGFLSGLAVLIKENGGLGILFFGMMILLSSEFNLKEKLFKLIKFGIFFTIPILTIQALMYKFFRYTYLDWYLFNKSFYLTKEGGKFRLILAHLSGFYRALGIVGWPLALLGLLREYKERVKERMKIYLALMPSSLSFLIWPSTDARLVFIFAPLGIMFVTKGLIYLKDNFNRKKGAVLIVFLIFISIVLNYYFHKVGDYFPFFEINDFVRTIFNNFK